jgi:uncharacterized protein YjdB
MQTLRRLLGFLTIACALALCQPTLPASAASTTSIVAPQQLTVTAANSSGDSVYDLTLTTTSTSALISGIQALNTDGPKHGAFDALVWAPNASTGTLDLIVADSAKGQILRYSGPNYGAASVIFTYSKKGSGPACTAGLAVDGAGNLYVLSPSSSMNATPSLWVLPFNKTTGAFGAPVLIDDSFSGVRTLALAEVLVASTAATPEGSAAPAWNMGDVLVLVGDSFDSRVIVYSKVAIAGVLAKPTKALSGPTSTVVTSKQFLNLIAVPVGMDIWPADATHGVSLLFTTIDGRIIRFDSAQNTFTSNFASAVGFGLAKVKVGTYAGKPYAFVTQRGPGPGSSAGQILQFGAPPASGPNKALASITKGVNEPLALAVTGSGSTSASSCVAPSSCSPVGPQFTTQISGPGASKIPAGATILEQSCTVATDPRVAVTGGVWSCLGPTINVCGANPTPGCVPATLDVANYCPGFPSTILPATMCGHSGANGASFQVIEGTAELLDENANDIYIQNSADPTVALPGPYDLGCQNGVAQQYGQIVAFAPRSDLPTIEGTIIEDMTAPFFAEFTGYCDTGGSNTHVASMFAFGLGLNEGANGLGTGPTAGLYGFVTTKFNNLSTMIQEAAAQTTPATVTTTLENYVTQSQTYFNNDYHNDVNDYSCALNSIASADLYLRNEAGATPNVFSYTAPAGGNNNPNPAGEIDARWANLYQSISGDFLYAPNPTWPTTNVPPCVTLTIAAANNSVAVGGSTMLTFGPPAPQFASTPLLYTPTQCTLSASDGTYTTPATVGTSGSVSTGMLTKSGTYTATLECAGASADTASSFATASVAVSSTPTLTAISLTPNPASVAAGTTQQFAATGTYSSGPTQPLTSTSVGWGTTNGVATVNDSGLAMCLTTGISMVTATSGSIVGSATLNCTAAVLASVTVSPPNPSVAAGDTQQFTASGTNSLNVSTPLASVSWSSGTPATASINSNTGLAKCLTTGSTLITATSGGISGTTTLNCGGAVLASVTVSPPNPSVAAGDTQQFAASGTNSLNQPATLSSVAWLSNNTNVATIDPSSGLATCLSTGNSLITASSGLVSGSTTLTCTGAVLTAISVTPATPTLTAGQTQQFMANGTNSLNQSTTPTVTWTSGTPSVAAITTGGLATCALQGSTTITATSGAISGGTTLYCNPGPLAVLTLPTPVVSSVGANYQYNPVGTDAGGNVVAPGTVTYNSTNLAVASVSSTGDATCLTGGSSTITAMSGNVTSNPSLLNCGGIALSANPTTTKINTYTTLTWTSADLPAGESCTLSSNSSDNALNITGEPTSGSMATTEAVPQTVTYTISCTGAETVSSSVNVQYTLVTTYQYTGNQFPYYDAYQQYASGDPPVNSPDRVIASLTVSAPLPPNANITNNLPGALLTLSDGLQTLTQQIGSNFLGLTTDGSGNISTWALGFSKPGNDVISNGVSYMTTDAVSTQAYPPDGSVDLGYQNYVGTALGQTLCLPAGSLDCASIANNPGTWTSTNANDLHVMLGTKSGTNPTTGQLYQVIVGGTAAAPTLSATTILSETPEPAACFGGPTGASGLAAAITGLAFVPNATTGFNDLVAANGNAGDVFLLSGPSYQPTADINSASPNCWNTGPAGISVAADASGDVVGAGHDVHNSQTPALYYFPPSPTGAAPNFVLIDNVNTDTSLTGSCPTAGCVNTLVDAVVAQNAVSGSPVAAGDMLVLVGDAYTGISNGNVVVMRLPAASIQAAKAYSSNCPNSFGNSSGTPTPCVTNSGGSQLVTQTTLASVLLDDEAPQSLDISPIDGSLFIATSLGNIYQLSATATGYANPTKFASGQVGIKQLRVGRLNNVQYVFASLENGSNSIVTFVGAPPAGGFSSSGTGVAYATVDGTAVGLAVSSPSQVFTD